MSDHITESDAGPDDTCETVYVVERWHPGAEAWVPVSDGFLTDSSTAAGLANSHAHPGTTTPTPCEWSKFTLT